MKTTLTSIAAMFAKIENVVVGQDFYFTENIGCSDLGGSPSFHTRFKQGSYGLITYTNTFNTYWTKSVANLVESRDELAYLLNKLMVVVQNAKQDLKDDESFKIPRTLDSYVAKASDNIGSDFSPSFYSPFTPVVKHYDDIEYDECKSSSDHCYLIDGLNFKQMNEKNESTFSAASFLTHLFGHYDLMAYLLNDEDGFLWSVLTAYDNNSHPSNSFKEDLLNCLVQDISISMERLHSSICEFNDINLEREEERAMY